MELFWRENRIGLRLILVTDEGEQEVGGIRKTPRGFDAFARTFGYEPGRAQKDIESLEAARDFVESFRPWELFVGEIDIEVEPDSRQNQ
jgi:hypothetical protein